MLQHHEATTVTVGESELTFLELAARLENKQSLKGLAGAVYRVDGRIERGPKRRSIDDLDTLASPHDYFDTHIVMTSRGCPWACTFCGAESQWGRGFRAHSIDYILDTLERVVERLPVKMVMIKDDTFTTNRKRVIELCRGIRARASLRAAYPRRHAQRRAAVRDAHELPASQSRCGIGAPEILRQVDKKITVQDIIDSTNMAKKYGINVRYFMMLGNRGETTETFSKHCNFERSKPHEYIFSAVHLPRNP